MSSGITSVVECPRPNLRPNSVRVFSEVSLISAGTERMLVSFGKASYANKARQQPEKVRMVIDKIKTDGLETTFNAVKSKLNEPMPLGYSNVGVVESVGDGGSPFKVGDRVVSNGAHADIVVVNNNLCAVIPDLVDNDSAAFTVVASIGLQGVRLASPTLGECFVVIGAGLIGLLTVQLLRSNGCRVLAVDYDENKLSLARQFGAETANRGLGEDHISLAKTFSRGRGVDGVIITASSNSNEPVKDAAMMCRKRGRIVLVGVVGLTLDRADFYEKELSFQVSCSYGPGRYDSSYEDDGNDYPVGFVRWTEQRNFEAVLDLMASGGLDVKPLISNRFALDDAASAYEQLIEDSSGLGILLEYHSPSAKRDISSVGLGNKRIVAKSSPSLGVIGAGNYASRVLIPAFKKLNVSLHTLVTQNGVNGVIHGKPSGFLRASSDTGDVLKEAEIDTVIVATQHDSHALYAIESLNANKNVWIEKPLAINYDSLSLIEDAYYKANQDSEPGPQLMVGFNRRFSPHGQKMHQLLSNIITPKSVVITVNAGSIPKDHWTQNPLLGGGRIIGEGCHFIDFVRFLVGKKITSVNARAMVCNSTREVLEDQSSITLGFEDGSIGTILYLANGAQNFPKERVEVFTDGKILQLDNFRKLKGYGWKTFNKLNLWNQDKGQHACAEAFISSIMTGIPCIPIDELLEVARVTIEANDILMAQK